MTRLFPAGLLTLLLASPMQSPVAQRDQPPPQQQPTTRLIAIGTASIAGTITAADSGRPVRGARVMVSGSLGQTAGRRGGPPLPASVAPPVSARSQGPGVSVQQAPGAAVGRSGVTATGRPTPPVPMSASRSAVTDDQGSFLIDKLPAGQYTLMVSPRSLFLQANYGQKKPLGPGSAFPLADGQRARVDMQLMRGGVITGTAFGEDGDPLNNCPISAWRFVTNNGIKRLQRANGVSTDDRGMYRLFGLQPGDYLVSATPNSGGFLPGNILNADDALIAEAIASGAVTPPAGPGLPATVAVPVRTPQMNLQIVNGLSNQPPGYLPVFYPSTSVPAGATVVHITGGDERAGIDIPVRLVQATNIEGAIANMPGEGMTVQLSLVNDDPLSENGNGARPDNNGHFVFRNVAPGKYTILAQVTAAQTITLVNGVSVNPNPQPPKQPDESQRRWGRTLVTVDGEPTVTADVTLKAGRVISGRVVFEMERPPDLTRQKLQVSLNQAPGVQLGMFSPLPVAEVGLDGSFTLKGVGPGKYTLRAQLGFLKSVMVNGRDVLDFPLDFTGERDVTDAVVTVSDKSSQVLGVVTDATGKPAVDFTIVAAPTDEHYWTPGSRRIQVSRPSPDGQYSLYNLPPGDYMLAAVTDLENGGQFDPDFLKSLAAAAAMHISVTEGGKIMQDLRVVR